MNSFLQKLTKTLQKEDLSLAEGTDNCATETLSYLCFPKACYRVLADRWHLQDHGDFFILFYFYGLIACFKNTRDWSLHAIAINPKTGGTNRMSNYWNPQEQRRSH